MNKEEIYKGFLLLDCLFKEDPGYGKLRMVGWESAEICSRDYET